VIALLDVNVLLAMLRPRHIFFRDASRWFAANRIHGWATCPLTEAGFVRLYTQPAVTGIEISIAEAQDVLATNCAEPDHVFWPQDSSLANLLPEIRGRLAGHQPLSDAILLDLAIRKGGRLATLDRRVPNLLSTHSQHRGAIDIIPVVDGA
jgi:toxin-antitoxin system PIN domain toxin